MGKVKEEAEDGGSMLAMEWALLILLSAHRKGSSLRLLGAARGDRKWEEHEEAGGPFMGGVAKSTWM